MNTTKTENCQAAGEFSGKKRISAAGGLQMQPAFAFFGYFSPCLKRTVLLEKNDIYDIITMFVHFIKD
jgi:hypothetical protein